MKYVPMFALILVFGCAEWDEYGDGPEVYEGGEPAAATLIDPELEAKKAEVARIEGRLVEIQEDRAGLDAYADSEEKTTLLAELTMLETANTGRMQTLNGEIAQIMQQQQELLAANAAEARAAAQRSAAARAAASRTANAAAAEDALDAALAGAADPPPPPPPPAVNRVEVALADANQKVSQGTTLFRELIGATKNLPDDPAQLQAILGKNQNATALFNQAKVTYSGVRAQAPDPAEIDGRIGRIDKVLSLLSKYDERIRAKMGQ